MERVHDLAVDVELHLTVRGVADAHGLRVLISRQPRDMPLAQETLPAQAVHDLNLVGAAGSGAQQPVPPFFGLLVIAGVHQREKGERGVAEPAVAIVPVANSADELGERHGRRGDDAACGTIGQ